MTTAPLYHPTFYDENARKYLDALQSGQKLESQLEFGRWEALIKVVDETFEQATHKGPIVQALLQSMIKTGKYPGLAELLSNAVPADISRPVLSLVEPSDPLMIPPLPAAAQLSPSLAKGACQWLDAYIIHSKQVSPEGYEDFHEACGLWMLSTIAGRRLKIPFAKKQYTPLMIVLVARTSLYAKSNTAEAAIDVLRGAGLKWLLGADETTPQKLLSDMAGAHVPKNYGELEAEKQYVVRQRLAMSAQRGWYYDEFGSLVRSMGKQGGAMGDFKGLLLKLDNCADSYEYSTQSRGSEMIDKPYLSLLGSMTPSDIRSNARSGSDFWSDGFWARFAFVCPPPDTALDKPFDLGEIPISPTLTVPLWQWHQRLGEPDIDVEAKYDERNRLNGYSVTRTTELPETTLNFGEGVYDGWVRYRSALKDIMKNFSNQDLDGSYQRLCIKAMRVAALFASLENNNIIELRHWAKAQEIAERWRKSLHELYQQVNQAELTPSYAKNIEDRIMRTVEKLQASAQPPTVRDLSRYIKGVSVGSLKVAVADLVRVGLLAEDREGRSPRYLINAD